MNDKYKILVVNEDELISTMEKLQELEDYTVEITNSAILALEKVKSDKYHIVLIDIDITDMDGIELLKEVKTYDALTQIIMMTGHSTMDKILSSLEYGANDYITKPFENSDKVIQTINYSIEKLERWRESIIEIVK